MIKRMFWFERKFETDLPAHLFPGVIERLRGTPARLEERVRGLTRDQLTRKPHDSWSIQENAGHLGDVEPLWLGRLDDFDAGVTGTDVFYAKSWGPMLTTLDPVEDKRITDQYKDWIADERRMALANEDAVYMHPLPADRNIEVSDGVIDGPHSVVFDQAENRLHAQKAVMALTMA